jgi:hypothetical protein
MILYHTIILLRVRLDGNRGRVWPDPTGKFILLEKVRTKLMSVPAPLKIALITRGRLASNYTMLADDGWSLLRFRAVNLSG